MASDSRAGRDRSHDLRRVRDRDGPGAVEPSGGRDVHSRVLHALGATDAGLPSIGRIVQPCVRRMRERRPVATVARARQGPVEQARCHGSQHRSSNACPCASTASLAGVPLHDVWAVDLPRHRSGITLDEFLRAARRDSVRAVHRRASAPEHPSPGRPAPRLGSRAESGPRPRPTPSPSRLTSGRRLAVPGDGGRTRRGSFRIVYRFENEQLPRLDQPHRPRRGAERAGRNGPMPTASISPSMCAASAA